MTFEYFFVHLLFDINKKKLSINFYLREINCWELYWETAEVFLQMNHTQMHNVKPILEVTFFLNKVKLI